MNPPFAYLRIPTSVRIAIIAVSTLLVLDCGGKDSNGTGNQISLAPFIQAAKESVCHEIRNRLFLIDQHLVFWDRAGNCPDNSYAQILYADSPNVILCERHDSIGGEVKTYRDLQYKTLFDTAASNIDQPNLGLDGSHTIQAIPF
jgi:hypothetical protein